MSLRAVTLEDLERLLRAVDAGSVRAPISKAQLAAARLGHLYEDLVQFDDLDTAAIAAVAEAVIAERTARAPTPDLVWTGPETPVSSARDTAVVVRELFAAAKTSVLVAGFRFDHGAEILRPLHEAMRARGVRTSVFLDGDQAPRFASDNWPFGDPHPDVFYDPRTAASGVYSSMHAKCVVVDDRLALVTSANFTDRGHTRNIEAGVLVDDAAFARKLAAQWRALVDAGLLRKLEL